MIYQPGERVKIYADIYPALISPLPPGVPDGSSFKFRIIVTERAITVGWSFAGQIGRVDIEVPAEEVARNMTYRGGSAGGYTVMERSGCPTCGARHIRSWHPFPDLTLVSVASHPA